MSRTHRLDHIEGAKIILFSSELKQDKDIAHELGIIPRTVRKWRERWLAIEARLLLIDSGEKGVNYIRKILTVLSDNERSGSPPEQVCQIINVVCERPEDSSLPIRVDISPAAYV